jgi:hypothetical protein
MKSPGASQCSKGGMNSALRPPPTRPAGWLIGSLTLLLLVASGPAQAQISSVTRRTLQTPPAITIFLSTNAVALAPPRVVVSAPQRTAPKSDAEKAEEQQRIIAFQKLRAEAGKAVFQYDLGLRYLKGEGVEPDLELARKWIAAAAKQGHEQARKKLEEMDKAPPPTP